MSREVENVYPLSPMQKGMLFHSMLEPHSGAYFEQVKFELRGNLNLTDFEKSVTALIKRHAILRTNFYSGLRDQPLQVVYKNRDAEFIYKDLRKMKEEQRKSFITTFTREDRTRGFHLAKDMLIRMSLLHYKENGYHVIFSFHHILMDGWCLPVIFKELFEIYNAIQEQRHPKLAAIIPYSRYIEWLDTQDLEKSSNYWSAYLDSYEGQTILPFVKSPSKQNSYISDKVICNLGKELTQQMKQLAGANQVTINTFIQTAWGVLLQKYNNSEDVVFGSVVSGRPEEIPGIEKMIGLFINTIPVRVRIEKEVQFVESLRKNQELALSSHGYDTYPLYEIQAKTEQKQGLLSHIMVFENYPIEQQFEGVGICGTSQLELTNLQVEEHTNYDFNLIVMPGEELQIQFQYNASVYNKASVERIQGHLLHIMKQVLNNPQLSIEEIEVLTEDEKVKILEVFNDTETAYPEMGVHQLFEEQARFLPDRAAVVFEGEQLTYRELNERANQLARTLHAEGLQENQLVGIMAERSAEMIIGILGILKAGGAYVPIDPEYPEDRILYILEDSGSQLLLTQHDLLDRIPLFKGKLLHLDDDQSYHNDGSNLELFVRPDQLAYVIYTSGTTGKPKGVMVEHHGLCNLKVVLKDILQMNEQDKVVQFASLSFDASVWEIFTALFFGATLYVPSRSVIIDYQLFTRFMNDNKITTALLPPSYAIYLDPIHMPFLSKLVTGGSASSFQLLDVWRDKVEYINAYGPTEDSIITTLWSGSRECIEYDCIPIGRPIHNHRVYIMDRAGQLLPIGVPGELCIAGVGIARGYLNRPELTTEKFVDSAFVPGEKVYRTGDLARWLPDGNIEYLGRIDHQVKIRGYRIELGEVESALLNIESVQEAAVIAYEGENELKHLFAYIVGNGPLTVGHLRNALSQELPSYMIPSYFVQLEQMPLTPNGKIDRKALPAPNEDMQSGTEYLAPRTPIEEQLTAIWQDVLGRGKVGIQDNFFDLGGHSLRATTLVSKIHKELDIRVALRDVFQYPTIEKIAALITGEEQHTYIPIPNTEKRDYYPVSSQQKRMYILSQLEGAEFSYNVTNIINVNGVLHRPLLEEAFRQLIQRHESLRTGFEIINGDLMQHVHPEVEFTVEYVRAAILRKHIFWWA
ncbi:amino acid adenylation domain-containing protein [Paenibacillus thiaminolyticus]|uniref:non-ribosomal peptide synthetase n=1 Tax=Paenibacillus thiaminolyticus TaxID=49283 RepID=UPI0035A5F8E1